jgi:release factor glutamine methyltransferase
VTLEPTALAALVGRLRAAGCVFADDEAALLAEAAGSAGELSAMVSRRLDGVPVEQVVGWAEFCGLRIAVEPGVFVPRRRTEALARAVAKAARAGSVVVDMCCGSGAVGVAVATLVPGVELHAVDVDPSAVRCARRNLAPYGGHAHEGDLFAPLPASLRGRVDLVAVNAPYVPTDEIDLMPPEARLHEPLIALDGGSDGLDVHRRVAAGAAEWLAVGGAIHAECSERQASRLLDVYAAAGVNAMLSAT